MMGMRKNASFSKVVSLVLALGAVAVWAQLDVPRSGGSSIFGAESPSGAQASHEQQSLIQNAVIEGLQLTSEDGTVQDEVIISCYFIFRDKPTSYFYEAKPKENKIFFEFNDTQLGSSPIPSMKETPIQGFRIEPTKVNVNAEVKGLLPEWHDVIRVSFFMDGIPELTVKDEYSVISFSFKWSKDPEKIPNYTVIDESRKVKLALFAGGAGVAAGVGGYFLYKVLTDETPPTPIEDLTIDDLPGHPSPN